MPVSSKWRTSPTTNPWMCCVSTCAMSSDLTITRRRDCCDGSCLKGLSGRFERKPATAIPYALLNKNLRRRFPAPSGSRCRSHRIKQFNCLRRVYGPMAGLRSNLPHEPSCPLRLLDFTNSAVALRAGQVRSSFYQNGFLEAVHRSQPRAPTIEALYRSPS